MAKVPLQIDLDGATIGTQCPHYWVADICPGVLSKPAHLVTPRRQPLCHNIPCDGDINKHYAAPDGNSRSNPAKGLYFDDYPERRCFECRVRREAVYLPLADLREIWILPRSFQCNSGLQDSYMSRQGQFTEKKLRAENYARAKLLEDGEGPDEYGR